MASACSFTKIPPQSSGVSGNVFVRIKTFIYSIVLINAKLADNSIFLSFAV
jgi:hypothetical protein